MQQIDSSTKEILTSVARNYPQFVDWLKEWKQRELEMLPNSAGNVAIAQGRCQVLKELFQALAQAPLTAVKPLIRTPTGAI